MNEHMRVGHEYPTIRQALAYSFGLDSPGLRRRLRDRRPRRVRRPRPGAARRPRAGGPRSATRRSCSGIHRPIDEILDAPGRRVTRGLDRARTTGSCAPAGASRSTPRRSGSCARPAARSPRTGSCASGTGSSSSPRRPELCAEVTLMPVARARRRRGGAVRRHHAAARADGRRRCGSSPRSARSSTGRSARPADVARLRPFDPAERVVHARRDPARPARARRPGRASSASRARRSRSPAT